MATDVNDYMVSEDLSPEDLEGASQDHFRTEGFKPMEPGRYLSMNRTHDFRPQGKKVVKVSFGQKGSFQTTKGEKVNEFPPFENLTFFMQKEFQGEGEISRIGDYLRAAGLKYRNWSSTDELRELLSEADNIPVIVRVGWEEDYKAFAENCSEDGVDPKKTKKKKTSFFKNADGKFVHQRQDEKGRTITARSVVLGYERYKS